MCRKEDSDHLFIQRSCRDAFDDETKQDRLLRAKASFESEAETLRARTAELLSANTSIEREMRNGQQDVLSR